MLRSEYLKRPLFIHAYYFTIKRYSSVFKSEYFSREKQIASNFYDRFFFTLFRLQKLQKQLKWKDFYKEIISKPIAYLHTNTTYQVTSLKGDWSFRYYYIPNLYLVIVYELYVSCIIRLVEEAIKTNLGQFLINWRYFSFAHQISTSWTVRYVDLWKKYLENQEKLIRNHNFYLKTDIKSFYDSIPHDRLFKLFSHFLKDYLKREKYLEYDVDNFLSDFCDIIFKVSRYTNKGLPQGMRWSDYLAVLYLWLLFFYERENMRLSFIDQTYWRIWESTNFILYSDDILFVGDNKQELFNNANNIIQTLYNYGLTINQSKTTDVLESSAYKYQKRIIIDKLKRRDQTELLKFKEYIKECLKKQNIEEISSPDFKTYFKWCFLLEFDADDIIKFREILIDIYGKAEFLNSQRIAILLLTISESSIGHLLNLIEKGWKDSQLEKIFSEFIQKFKNLLSDSTLLGILKYFPSDPEKSTLKKVVIRILKERENPIIDCFIKKNQKNFFSSYCKSMNFHGLENLLSIASDKHFIDWNMENFEENIIWLKLNNLFGLTLGNINFSRIKMLEIWNKSNLWKEDFIYQMAEVVDSLLYQKHRNPNYFMKSATFIADFLSLVNQLVTILVSIKRGVFISCHISFTQESDFDVIQIWEEKKSPKESFSQNDIKINPNDRLFFYYLQKKRAALHHKESQSAIDFTHVSYNISKYENSEVFFNSAKLILDNLCHQITEKINDL